MKNIILEMYLLLFKVFKTKKKVLKTYSLLSLHSKSLILAAHIGFIFNSYSANLYLLLLLKCHTFIIYINDHNPNTRKKAMRFLVFFFKKVKNTQLTLKKPIFSGAYRIHFQFIFSQTIPSIVTQVSYFHNLY